MGWGSAVLGDRAAHKLCVSVSRSIANSGGIVPVKPRSTRSLRGRRCGSVGAEQSAAAREAVERGGLRAAHREVPL